MHEEGATPGTPVGPRHPRRTGRHERKYGNGAVTKRSEGRAKSDLK